MKNEERKKQLAKLAKGNIGKALREEFDIEIANLKEDLLNADSIEDIYGVKAAITSLRKIQSRIDNAGRVSDASAVQDEYA